MYVRTLSAIALMAMGLMMVVAACNKNDTPAASPAAKPAPTEDARQPTSEAGHDHGRDGEHEAGHDHDANARTSAAAASAEPAGPIQVVIETSMGDIVVELTPDKTPITVANFLQYADDGFFDGTLFHRVIKSFMIQGGGFGTDRVKKATRAPIVNEAKKGTANKRGTIAMGQVPGNEHSATSQFFINHRDNANLDMGTAYCVFGRVVEGMDVVDKIAVVPTTTKEFTYPEPNKTFPAGDVPVEDVVIRTIRRK